jgi:DNA-binding MarR family transcriptional regulator
MLAPLRRRGAGRVPLASYAYSAERARRVSCCDRARLAARLEREVLALRAIRRQTGSATKGEEHTIASLLDTAPPIDLGPIDSFIGYHMRRASAALGSDFARAVEGTGMRQVLFGILSVISANPGINQGSVGRVLGIQRPNMVTLVNELIQRDLVTRAVDTDDRRAFVLSLTPAGEAVVAETLARLRRHEERMLSDLSATERATLIRLLSRIEAKDD